MRLTTICAVALGFAVSPSIAAEPLPISSGTWELKQGVKAAKIPLVVHHGDQNIVTIYRICQDNGPEMRLSFDTSARLAAGRCLDVVTASELSVSRSSDTSVDRATGHFHLLFAAKK